VVVVPVAVHPVIVLVTQLVCVIVATAKLLVAPGMKDVDRETVSVQIGTAVLPVQEVEDEEEEEPSDIVEDC
jgi:hypothetical protein